MQNTLNGFIGELSSGAPVPGGGGASALIGALSSSLCSMVANLTTGKKKYAQYQADIERILADCADLSKRLLTLIEKDAEVFSPLAQAYSLPKDDPARGEKLELALKNACTVPLEILKEASGLADIIEELKTKGSRLAISDVGVAAAACRAALEGAAMNVYINTKLMTDKEYAAFLNGETAKLLSDGCNQCDKIYLEITDELRCGL